MEEALDLSFDRLLMMMVISKTHIVEFGTLVTLTSGFKVGESEERNEVSS